MIGLESFLGDGKMVLKIGRFLLTLALGSVLTRAVLMPATERMLKRRRDAKSLHSIVNLVGITGLFLTFTVALQAGSFGNLATIIGAIAAALTVAVGFGMREQVANVVAGILIHFDTPFIRGDYIKVDDVEGVVKEIKLRETVLNGSESEKTGVPNAMITTRPSKNFTRGRHTKTSISVKVDPEKYDEIRECLLDACDHERVLDKPEPEVLFGSVDEEVKAELHYWVRHPEELKRIRSQVMERYLEKARERGLLEEKET